MTAVDLRAILQPVDRDLDPKLSEAPEGGVSRRKAGSRAARAANGLLAVVVVLAASLVTFDLEVPGVRPLMALVLLVGVPTLALHRRARLPADSAAARLLHSFGLTVLGIILVGLLLNTVLPLLGVDRPLAPKVLGPVWLVIDLALLAWRRAVPLAGPASVRTAAVRALRARIEPAQALSFVAVLAAVAGAVRLNNGAGGGVALVAVVLAAAALLTLLLGRSRTLGRDARTLALVATSLLLATSLRGWHITGHDVQAEFLTFQITNGAQHWRMSAFQNAYNACLSVNILPTVLAQASGLAGEVVFKCLLQLVFALVPVLTFLLSRRFVTRRLALAAAAFTMAFPTFYTDMPYLVRQEVAFFFLALLLLAGTEPGRKPWHKRGLAATFGVGVVLSHYSTTYVLLIALVIALLVWGLAAALRRLARPPGRSGEPLVLLHPALVVVLVALTLAWAGPITETGGHASSVVTQTLDALKGKGESGPSSSDTSYSFFSRGHVTARERMDMFVGATLNYRDTEIPADQRVVTTPGPDELRPALLPAQTAGFTPLGRALDSVGISPVHVGNAAKLGCALLMQAFALLGLVWLLRRRRPDETPAAFEQPDPSDPPMPTGPSRELACLTIGMLAALALIVLTPNLSVDYGVLRVFQQSLLVIAPTMAMGLWLALRPFRLGARTGGGARRARVLTAMVPVALFLVLTGALPAAIGGQQQRLALANAGNYYDRFFASDSESRATQWLVDADRADTSNDRIIASRNDNVRLLAASGNQAAVSDRLFPTLLTRGSYVFVDGQIVDRGVSTIFYTGDLLTYAYPIHDLNRHLDLVYSSPQARIYR